MKYSIKDFNKEFPTNRDCVDYLIKLKYGPKAKLYPIRGRISVYANSNGKQFSPLKGTIFEKSTTPLRTWFYAIFLFLQSDGAITAKEVQRKLGVTYKCAWRITKQIRAGLSKKKISPFALALTKVSLT